MRSAPQHGHPFPRHGAPSEVRCCHANRGCSVRPDLHPAGRADARTALGTGAGRGGAQIPIRFSIRSMSTRSCGNTLSVALADHWAVRRSSPIRPVSAMWYGAPGGIRTPDLLIRSQLLYPLSYGRTIHAQRERITRYRQFCHTARTALDAEEREVHTVLSASATATKDALVCHSGRGKAFSRSVVVEAASAATSNLAAISDLLPPFRWRS